MEINKKRFEKIYEQAAEINQTSTEQLKAEMQLALDIAWNINNVKLMNLFPNGKPTIEEFLLTVEGEISGDAEY